MEKEKLKSFSPMYKLIFQLTIELHYVRIHSQKTIKLFQLYWSTWLLVYWTASILFLYIYLIEVKKTYTCNFASMNEFDECIFFNDNSKFNWSQNGAGQRKFSLWMNDYPIFLNLIQKITTTNCNQWRSFKFQNCHQERSIFQKVSCSRNWDYFSKHISR